MRAGPIRVRSLGLARQRCASASMRRWLHPAGAAANRAHHCAPQTAANGASLSDRAACGARQAHRPPPRPASRAPARRPRARHRACSPAPRPAWKDRARTAPVPADKARHLLRTRLPHPPRRSQPDRPTAPPKPASAQAPPPRRPARPAPAHAGAPPASDGQNPQSRARLWIRRRQKQQRPQLAHNWGRK